MVYGFLAPPAPPLTTALIYTYFYISELCVQFNTEDGFNWKIGAESFLTDDNYNCNSKHILIIFILLQVYILNIYVISR